MINPISFLIRSMLMAIRAVLSLLKSGNISEAISRLEEIEGLLEKESKE